MKIVSAELKSVCGITSVLPENELPEVAFYGRSNVGKSSLLNALVGRKSLARTSSEPGKTQTINYYEINRAFYFVDLPGYGYAKTSMETRKKWLAMTDRYLRRSKSHCLTVLLIDHRHAPTKDDVSVFQKLCGSETNVLIALTKSDKLSANERAKALKTIRETLSLPASYVFYPVSSEKKTGLTELLDEIEKAVCAKNGASRKGGEKNGGDYN